MPEHPDRSLRFLGASNFRDLGGYRSAAGGAVRWRTLFRSDHLAHLTPQDAAAFAALGIRRVFDFRGVRERAALPYALPGVTQYPLPVEPTVVQRMQELLDAGSAVTPGHAVELMQQTYRAFVHDNADAFGTLLAHLLQGAEPLVFHCTAGKDRTGFAAALILLALGVPQGVVMQDYLLTNRHYRMPDFAAGRAPRAVIEVLWRVQADFLEAALDAVQRDFGGIDAYLAGPLKLGPPERARLRELYLDAG